MYIRWVPESEQASLSQFPNQNYEVGVWGIWARVLVLDRSWCAEVLSLRRRSSTLHTNIFWISDEHQKRAQRGSAFHFPTQMILVTCMTFLEDRHS